MSICILRMDADIWNLRLEKANVVKQIVRRGKAMSQNLGVAFKWARKFKTFLRAKKKSSHLSCNDWKLRIYRLFNNYSSFAWPPLIEIIAIFSNSTSHMLYTFLYRWNMTMSACLICCVRSQSLLHEIILYIRPKKSLIMTEWLAHFYLYYVQKWAG